MIVGNTIGGMPMMPKTCVFKNENGQEFYASLVDNKFMLTAGINDIRDGKTAITDMGMTTGEKIIPAYHTTEGYRIIPSGSTVTIPNITASIDSYDYTQLQAMICLFNTNEAGSVSTEKVVIGDHVYNVQSIEPISEVTKNDESKQVELGITNDSDTMWILRFFMYKEIE